MIAIQYLVVGARVSDDDDARLQELLVDLVSEGARGEAARQKVGASVLAKLVAGALTVRAARDDNNVSRVLAGDDDAGSQHQLLPGGAQVDQVDT